MEPKVAAWFVAALTLVPVAEAARTHVAYDGPAVLAYQDPSDCRDPARRTGTLCFALPADATTIGIRVRDATHLDVGGAFYLHDATGAPVGSGSFCRTIDVPLAGRETTLVVRLEAVNGPLACLAEGADATGPATKGVVTVRAG